LIPADAKADLALRGGPSLETQIARGEIKLFVIGRIVGDMHLAILADDLAAGANEDRRVVIKTGGPLLEKRGDDNGRSIASETARAGR
jgi:hypothetical protein